MAAVVTREERFRALDEDLQDILLEAAEMGLVAQRLRADEDLAIAALRHNSNFEILRNVVLSQRDAWMYNFARGMAQSPNLIDQREVDEKRGYFKGAVYYVNTLPRISQWRVESRKEE